MNEIKLSTISSVPIQKITEKFFGFERKTVAGKKSTSDFSGDNKFSENFIVDPLNFTTTTTFHRN